MKKVYLLINERSDPNFEISNDVVKLLSALGIKCCVSSRVSAMVKCEHIYEDKALSCVDLVISIGGDGTLLKAAGLTATLDIPVLGVNTGHTGFMTCIERNELSLLSGLAIGDYEIDSRMMISATLSRCGDNIFSKHALNDAVLTRGAGAQAIHLELHVDGQKLSSFAGDGLIIATPTGSTGYSLSAGGPIAEPNTHSIIITPICAHGLYARSFVLDSSRRITINSTRADERPPYLTIDGNPPVLLVDNDEIHICKSDRTTKICRLKNSRFFDIVSRKLGAVE